MSDDGPSLHYVMPDSVTLKILMGAQAFRDKMKASLIEAVRAEGFTEITESHLDFLSYLECGTNHAADLARMIGVTRQAVYKQTKSLSALGILTLSPNPENATQNIILYTPEGQRLMSICRHHLLEKDAELQAVLQKYPQEMIDDFITMLATS